MPKYDKGCPPSYEMDLYTGCPFGCVYCVARSRQRNPSVLKGAPEDLYRAFLASADCEHPVYLSPWTDAYQPLEGRTRATRAVLERLARDGHRFFVVTKSTNVIRDVDLFSNNSDSFIAISLSCLDDSLARSLEPGAPSASERRALVEEMIGRGDVRVVVKIDPVIPSVTDGRGLDGLADWIASVKPHAVTMETVRLDRAIAKRLGHALGASPSSSMLGHYPALGDTPAHPDLSYRMELFRKYAAFFAAAGIKASFCRASLPEPITPHDCRGGFA